MQGWDGMGAYLLQWRERRFYEVEPLGVRCVGRVDAMPSLGTVTERICARCVRVSECGWPRRRR